MQPKEIISVKVKYPFDIICDILNKTISDIKDTNNELSSIRNRTCLLESKNEALTEQLKQILSVITNINCTNSGTQSEIIQYSEIGVNSELTELCEAGVNCVIDMHDAGINCEIIELRETGINCETIEVRDVGIDAMKRSRPSDVPVDISVKEAVTAVKLIKIEDNMLHVDLKEITTVIKEVADIIQPTIEPTYSKTDMLCYLERYKTHFLTFAQRNKNNIEDNSNSCRDLIRSFSNNSVYERKRPRDDRSNRKKSEDKPGVIETGDNAVDEGIQSSLYDDLDYQNPLGSKKDPRSMTESEMSSVGGAKRLAALSNQSRRNLMVNRMERKRPRTTTEAWQSQLSTLEASHERTYPIAATEDPPRHEPIRATLRHEPIRAPHREEPIKADDTVFSQRMKDRLIRKFGLETHRSDNGAPPPPTLSTVKYDLSNADSPLFQVHTPTKPPASVPHYSTVKKSHRLIEEVAGHTHSRPTEEPKERRKPSSKKRSPRRDKDLEEGEIV